MFQPGNTRDMGCFMLWTFPKESLSLSLTPDHIWFNLLVALIAVAWAFFWQMYLRGNKDTFADLHWRPLRCIALCDPKETKCYPYRNWIRRTKNIYIFFKMILNIKMYSIFSCRYDMWSLMIYYRTTTVYDIWVVG